MKLSKRLRTIADYISNGSRVIDVGCDHALLDVYLSLEKNCTCIATDINKNALEQARYNIARFQAKNITTILTDGLDGVDISEEDILVISGMGTWTITNILANPLLPNTMIISSHNDWGELRYQVVNKGYLIREEKFVEDKGKGYIIIVFEKGNMEYSEEDFTYGPILKNDKKYLKTLYDEGETIYNQIPDENEEKDMYKKRLIYIQSLIGKLQ